MTEWLPEPLLPIQSLPKKLNWSTTYSSEEHPSKVPYAAVAVLFCPGPRIDDPAHLVLTKRSLNVSTHKGQMSLAGGFYEPEDLTIGRTASRELREEIGISHQDIVIHGLLSPLCSIGGTVVYPVVMTTSCSIESMNPDGNEVAQIIAVPWTDLRRECTQPFTTLTYRIKRKSHLFVVSGANIWGLTAQIIYDAAFT